MKRCHTWGLLSLLGVIVSCHRAENAGNPRLDDRSSGTIRITIDEAFKPIMEEELKVFGSAYPLAHIIASYKPEAECLKDLEKDSTRLVFVTRGQNQEEKQYYLDRLHYEPSFDVVAYDAIAVIVNRDAPDSVFTPEEVAQILRGTFRRPYTAVFDGLNATSTIRFAMDSILKGAAFDADHVFAANNSTGVIRYVSAHKDAVGFVGVDWIGNPEDSLQDIYRETVRIAAIECPICPGKPFVLPLQQEILTKRYPFTRGLYYIMKENYDGLGTGLIDFMTYQRGQLIFRRGYLVPAILPFIVRNAKVQ